MSADWVLQRYEQVLEETKLLILLLEVKKLNKIIFLYLVFYWKVYKLSDNFNSDVETSHLGAIGVHDGGVSVESPAGQ